MITIADIRRAVSSRTFEAGLAYLREGRVREVRISADDGLIEARVQGSSRAPYRQAIRNIRGRNGQQSIIGECTCPVGFNCKHVAAVLFAVLDDLGGAGEQLPPFSVASPRRVATRARAEPTVAGRVGAGAFPPEIEAWLASLERAEKVEGEDFPPSVRKRLLYLLSVRPGLNGLPRLEVRLVSIELRKNGSTGRAHPYDPYQSLRAGPQPRFLRPSDRLLLRRLARRDDSWDDAADEDMADTLERVIATGRGRWKASDGPLLTLGEPRRAQLRWQLLPDGSQRPSLDFGLGAELIGLIPPWFIEPGSGTIGRVETDIPPRLLRALLSAPPVAAAVAPHVAAALARRLSEHAIPPPRVLDPPVRLAGTPQPHLDLLCADAHGRDEASTWSAPVPGMPVARLSFRYGPLLVAAFETRPVLIHNGALYALERDRTAEREALRQLDAVGFMVRAGPTGPTRRDLVLKESEDGAGWLDFLLDEVPKLRAAGWNIAIAEDFPLRLVQPSGCIEVEVHEGSGIDWFELELGVMIEGCRVDLVPPLLKLIAEADVADILSASIDTEDDTSRPLLLPLPDGRLLALPMATIRPTLATLFELFRAGGLDIGRDHLDLPRTGLADLARLEAAGAEAGVLWRGAEAVRALGRQLRDHGGIPSAALPGDFRATLRPYQARGVDWLQFLRAAELGGVLADDMGLGKTVQTLAHLAIEQAEGRLLTPALVVCPTSLVANWGREAARFAPRLRVLALHGRDRTSRFAAIPEHDVVITTYPLLFRDHAVLAAQPWHIVVLDEAQTIKNPLATTSVLARTLHADQRLCLSGTPIENHLGELWSLFEFLMPRFLGDQHDFRQRFRTPIEKAGDTDRAGVLARRVAPFMLRRTKAEVAAELPPKTEITETVELKAGQRAIYEGIRLAMHARVRAAIAERGLARSGIIILDALLKLRQVCCDPRLLRLAAARAAKVGSAKLERLMELLPALLEDGRRILLFSQFTSMLALIRAALDEVGVGYVLLTGKTSDRATPVARFQSGEVPLFLISLKAGGLGLNLTAADTVIHYDPWWNPAIEDQATDRAHRIGQQHAVFVHRLVTSGTIEEKMERLKARKQALVASILGAAGGSTLTMTEADLELLLAPIAPR